MAWLTGTGVQPSQDTEADCQKPGARALLHGTELMQAFGLSSQEDLTVWTRRAMRSRPRSGETLDAGVGDGSGEDSSDEEENVELSLGYC